MSDTMTAAAAAQYSGIRRDCIRYALRAIGAEFAGTAPNGQRLVRRADIDRYLQWRADEALPVLPTRRLPLQPLLDYVAGRYGQLDVRGIARRVGLAPSMLYRATPLTERVADRVAIVALGVHPSEVWGDLWWASPPTDE